MDIWTFVYVEKRIHIKLFIMVAYREWMGETQFLHCVFPFYLIFLVMSMHHIYKIF